ncbi:hypothetical protein NLI96_g9939 [Meripilus lineatus]|uniref:Uncharacterized protein n=1 Tax=Meripilus lineatus TaxID=2056292 RepID=A0AAD5UUK6_9APHY|nr:hypothetical protein NLI96_g9939 [Physisporinus lineatus]
MSLHASLTKILKALSPSLRTLACMFTRASGANANFSLYLGVTFPSLSEITIYNCLFSSRGSLNADFPVLKYAHFAYCESYPYMFHNMVPALTHVRLTMPFNQYEYDGRFRDPFCFGHPPQLKRLALLVDSEEREHCIRESLPRELEDITEFLLHTGKEDRYSFDDVEEDWIRGIGHRNGSYW